MNNETITPNAWQQQLEAVEGLRAQIEATPLGKESEDEIVDRYAHARDTLMRIQSPDISAAAWKASVVLIQAQDGATVPADVESLLADLLRLAKN